MPTLTINKHCNQPKEIPTCKVCGLPIDNPGRKGQLYHAGDCKRVMMVRRSTEHHRKHKKAIGKNDAWFPQWKRLERMILRDSVPWPD
jgi:hypothetical protein